MTFLYFDANATTTQIPVVTKAVVEASAIGPLNASSAHHMGDIAREIIFKTKETITQSIGYDDTDNVILVSSGTEANNIVINGFAQLDRSHMMASAVEHASISETIIAHNGNTIPVMQDGRISLEGLENSLNRLPEDWRVLVCIQAANSETGIIQAISSVVDICSKVRCQTFIHVDAAQAFGRIPISVEGIDSLAVSGHKFHAPIGTGFLYLSDRLANILPRTVHGGGQERGFRSGTQNVPGIAGLRVAVVERFNSFDANVLAMLNLRCRFETAVKRALPDCVIIGQDSDRLPNTSNIMFPGIDGSAMMARLDQAGICCSNGSACSSMKPSASPVLRAMGYNETEAFSCLRFSFSVLNTEVEIDTAIPEIVDAANSLRGL